MKKLPTRVTHDITAGKITTKIYSGNKCIATLNQKHEGRGTFGRKTHKIESEFPEFMGEVDDFHCTNVARELDAFAAEDHPDLVRDHAED